jgi:hypothetical protein
MSEQKSTTFRPPLYHGQAGSTRSEASDNARSADQKGWDAYRKWLSRVSARPQRERSTTDHSIYSWKGYNSWADRIKQTWKAEDSET